MTASPDDKIDNIGFEFGAGFPLRFDTRAAIFKVNRTVSFRKSIKNINHALFYSLTNNYISNYLRDLRICFINMSTAYNDNNNRCLLGVPKAASYAEAHMAKALASNWTKAGAFATALSAAALPAISQEQVTPSAQGADRWTDELREFDRAATAARNYAENNYGVGILIHVGTVFAEQGAEHNIGKTIVSWLSDPQSIPQEFIDKYCPNFNRENVEGVPAKYFLRYNDVGGTGITYHINHLIHGADNRTEVKPFLEGVCAIPDVAKALPAAKAIVVSSAEQAPTLDR